MFPFKPDKTPINSTVFTTLGKGEEKSQGKQSLKDSSVVIQGWFLAYLLLKEIIICPNIKIQQN